MVPEMAKVSRTGQVLHLMATHAKMVQKWPVFVNWTRTPRHVKRPHVPSLAKIESDDSKWFQMVQSALINPCSTR